MARDDGIPARRPLPARLLNWSGSALVAIAWLSAALFGTYIVFHYAGALAVGTPEQWNANLPGLFDARAPASTAGIALHFAAGGILLLLGPVQLLGGVRRRWPAFHRWSGRLYAGCAFLAGLGGITFILVSGTIGGAAMDIGFAGYGLLMVVAAVETWRHARARRLPGRLERHRAWAIRLFALAIGSWLYRMDYGFWFLATDGAGHTQDFRGWFDAIMDFAFYLPNLAVAEAFIRARAAPGRPALQLGGTLVMALAAAFLALATWEFATLYWLPAIADRLT
jgi:hypothetical protein